jgi:hypothetical protein
MCKDPITDQIDLKSNIRSFAMILTSVLQKDSPSSVDNLIVCPSQILFI